MSISILCVDDDPNILEGYRRLLGRRYDVYLACGPLQGLEKLNMGPYYSVILSDKHMPDMDGVEFLSRASQRFPASVRIMLTGDADQETAVDALNRGKIQHFLTKPCPSRLLEQAVDEAVAQARIQQQSLDLCQARRSAETQLLQALAWTRPEAAQRGDRSLQRAQALAQTRGMELPEAAEVALRLVELGALAVSPELWRKQAAGRKLDPQEAHALEQAPVQGAGVLAGMPGWEEAADLLLQAHGRQKPSILGELLKLAFDIERSLESRLSLTELLPHLRDLHPQNPWFSAVETAMKAPDESMACAA